jgi:hypothetical protein
LRRRGGRAQLLPDDHPLKIHVSKPDSDGSVNFISQSAKAATQFNADFWLMVYLTF